MRRWAEKSCIITKNMIKLTNHILVCMGGVREYIGVLEGEWRKGEA